jgi:hypothetical protein
MKRARFLGLSCGKTVRSARKLLCWLVCTVALTFAGLLFFATAATARTAGDEERIKAACDSEKKGGSTLCLAACRALLKSRGQKRAFSELSTRQKDLCSETLRQFEKTNLSGDPKCSAGSCMLKFIVVDPHADKLRYRGPPGYSLIKSYTCSKEGEDCLNTWELLSPSGEIDVFEQCSNCKMIKHVRGLLTKATLAAAGGLEGEDVLVRIPK